MQPRKCHVTAISAVVAALAALVVSGCGSSGGGSGGSPSGALTIGLFVPFSGPDAAFGPIEVAGCTAAINLINKGGGVLGHKLKCQSFDTRGDPADAVQAANAMIATTSNLVGVVGPSSDEADATAPLINAAHIPMFSETGETSFDHTKLQYFWRNLPSDSAAGYALAGVGRAAGYKRAAIILANGISAQANRPGLVGGFPRPGTQIAINLSLATDQSSYRTEVLRTIAAKPDVIFNEADPQSAATFFGEYKQLNHGVLPPVLETNVGLQPDWFQAVSGTIGRQGMTDISGVTAYAKFSGPAYTPYKQAMTALGTFSGANQDLTNPYVMSYYDSVNVMALAMLAARSVDPKVWNAYIPKVTASGGAPTVVSSFAAGKAKLPGTPVNYVGAIGPEPFNHYHNTGGAFEVARWQPNGQLKVIGEISAARVNAIAAGG